MPTFTFIAFILIESSSFGIDRDIDFNRDIRPILSEHCFSCHGPDERSRKAGLRLDLAESAFRVRGGIRAIVPGNVEKSELIRRISTDDSTEIMPPLDEKNPLSEKHVLALTRWIRQGAPYDDHWSFVAPTKPPVPSRDTPGDNEIDAFVRDRLRRRGLTPSPRAGKETLIRRAALDLTGLPPTEAEIDAFLVNDDPRAYEDLVDSLLERDATAERLALEWLDVARYADTNGYSIDDHRDMWPWRDWVIDAFSQNMPYDVFIVEQIAGDLLSKPSLEQRLATGFLRNAMNTHEGGTIPEEYRVASIVDKIDTVGTAFMGLTVKCAQCHDHKYDPISQREYYELFALFNQSSEEGEGAVNGNTRPTLSLGKDWGEREDVIAFYERRREDLVEFVAGLHLDERRDWEAGLGTSQAAPIEETRNAHDVFVDTQACWVWAPDVTDGDSLRVTCCFDLEKVPERAELAITCDNRAEVFLNGDSLAIIDTWMKPLSSDVSDRLQDGVNTLSIEASNEGGVAGLLVGLVDDERRVLLSSSSAWEFTRQPDARHELALEGMMKDLGPYGASPWGHFESAKAPRLDATRVASIREGERSLDDWRALLGVFAQILEADARVLLERQLAAVTGELELIDRFLNDREPTAMVMDSGAARTTHVLMRGQYDQPSDVVVPGVPAALSWPDQEPITDRLEFARWLVDTRHPLTARVTVNRYWQMLMGRGIVETSENLGSQGSWPSHPELLDWLSVSFIDLGWDVRWLLRTIMTSSTYCQQSRFTDELRERDPENRWLTRGARRRLPAEMIRDGALFNAGLLSIRLGGPSVYPDQPDGLWRQVSHFGYPGFFSAQSYYPSLGEDRYRRSLYTFWKRTASPPVMVVFDAPNRETCIVRRPITNTPIQALVTLNEEQFMNAARALGAEIAADDETRLRANLATVFRRCTSRLPSEAELEILMSAYTRHHAHYLEAPEEARALCRSKIASKEDIVRLAAATLLASTILNLDETLSRP